MQSPVEFSVLRASTGHGRSQFYLSGESQSPKLVLLRPLPPTLFPPLPPCSLKFARPAARLPRWHGQQADPPYHGPEESPAQMALGQEQPIITTMLHQPTARLH